jgi:TolA-binding protein
MKRLAGYASGKSMLRDDATFTNGVALVRSLVRDAPDAPGARGGLAAVARAYLDHGMAKESVAVYREIFDTWPDSVKSFELQYGLGSALRALGSYAEALETFAVAEECAATDEERAGAMVEQGNVLGESGKKDEMHAKFRNVLSKYSASAAAAGIKDIVRCRELEDEGRSMYGEYRFAEAQEKFREVAEKYPAERPRMEFFEVMCLYGQGLDDEAKKRAESIASGSSDREIRARATLWLAKLSYNGGDWSDARRRFADYAAMAPKAADAPEALVWSARAAFAASDFDAAIQTVTKLVEAYPESPSRFRGFLVQGEALIELARFDEAVLVLERTSRSEKADAADRLRAKLLRADALFAMGADNPQRYQEALSAYNDIALGESLDPSQKLSLAYKVARTLEKMKRSDEWEKGYYEKVVLEYRKGRAGGTRYNDEARAAFSRAAFRLADEYESRGRNYEARRVLELVATSDVPAAAEAAKRIDRIMRKERFL